MNLKEKLLKIQSELKAPKNQRNNFGNYNYRSCEDILEAVKPLLKETKTILTISDEPRLVGDRIYICASVEISDTESDENMTVNGYARESATKKGMDDSQITGSTSSYARKYALNGLFAIDDTKDADSTNKHGKGGSGVITPKTNQKASTTPQNAHNDVISPAQLKRLQAIATNHKVPKEFAKQAIGALGYASSKDIKKKDYEVIVKEFEAYGTDMPDALK